MIPYSIAFFKQSNQGWIIIDLIMDFFFGIEIVLTFFKAYYDSNFILIDKRGKIAKAYLKTWFFIDLIAIIPINVIVGTYDFVAIIRLLKLTKLRKSLNVGKLLKFFNVTVNIEHERLIGLIITFFVFCHIVA